MYLSGQRRWYGGYRGSVGRYGLGGRYSLGGRYGNRGYGRYRGYGGYGYRRSNRFGYGRRLFG